MVAGMVSHRGGPPVTGGEPVGGLAGAVGLQQCDECGGEVQSAVAPSRLGSAECQCPSNGGEVATHVEGRFVEVDGVPAESENFAASQTEEAEQGDGEFPFGALGGGEQRSHLGWLDDVACAIGGVGFESVGERGDVDVDAALADGVAQNTSERTTSVAACRHAESPVAEHGIKSVDVVDGEVVEANMADVWERGCHASVHLVRRGPRMFWRHNPGSKTSCILGDVEPNGEGEAHFRAKLNLAKAIASLNGYSVDCERPFVADGDMAIADVYAEHELPSGPHQNPMLWEIQLSPQAHGRFVERTEQAQRVAGHPRAWLTPFDGGLGDVRGIVTDHFAKDVTERLYTDPYMTTPLDSMNVGVWARSVARKRPKLLWSQSGEDGRWISYPPHSNMVAPVTREQSRHDFLVPEDRDCERPPAKHPTLFSPVAPSARADQLAVAHRSTDEFRPSYVPAVGEACSHYMAQEVDGRLYCTWCGDLLNWHP